MTSLSDSEVMKTHQRSPPMSPYPQRQTKSSRFPQHNRSPGSETRRNARITKQKLVDMLILEDFELGSKSTDKETITDGSIQETSATSDETTDRNYEGHSYFTSKSLQVPGYIQQNRGDVLGTGDYEIYPGNNISDFFGETIPNNISQICLVNDFYILVKINGGTTTSESQMTSSEPSPPSEEQNIRTSSSRKMFPIIEESEAESSEVITEKSHNSKEKPRSKSNSADSLKKPTSFRRDCWSSTSQRQEVFDSQTQCSPISSPSRKLSVQKSSRGLRKKRKSSNPSTSTESIVTPLSASIAYTNQLSKKPSSQVNFVNVQPITSTDLEIEEIHMNDNNNSKTQVKEVSLNNYGILITPTHVAESQVNQQLLVLQVDNELNSKNLCKQLQHPDSTSSGCNCWQWLKRIFSRRKRDTTVHANVFKTYFVKWKKPSENNKRFGAKCECQPYGKLLRRYNSSYF